VGTIVLRLGPAGELDLDAEAQPPDAEPAQVAAADAGERRAVVDPNDLREPATTEDRRHGGAGGLVVEFGDQPDGENKAGGQIADGEQIAARAIARAKAAFEVDGPNVIGRGGCRQRRASDHRARTFARRRLGAEASGAKPAVDGARGWPAPGPWMQMLQAQEQLAGAPSGMAAAQSQNAIQPQGPVFLRSTFWPARTPLQTGQAFEMVTLQPLVSGGPAQTKLATDSTEVALGGAGTHKLQAQGGRIVFPRHRPPKLTDKSSGRALVGQTPFSPRGGGLRSSFAAALRAAALSSLRPPPRNSHRGRSTPKRTPILYEV